MSVEELHRCGACHETVRSRDVAWEQMLLWYYARGSGVVCRRCAPTFEPYLRAYADQAEP